MTQETSTPASVDSTLPEPVVTSPSLLQSMCVDVPEMPLKWYYSEHALASITDLQCYVSALAANDQASGGTAFATAAFLDDGPDSTGDVWAFLQAQPQAHEHLSDLPPQWVEFLSRDSEQATCFAG